MHYCWFRSKSTLAEPIPNFKINGKLFSPTERHTASSKKEKDFVQTKPYTHTHKELCREQHQYAAPATELSPVRLDSYSQVLISSFSSTYKEAKQHKLKRNKKKFIPSNKKKLGTRDSHGESTTTTANILPRVTRGRNPNENQHQQWHPLRQRSGKVTPHFDPW